MELDSLPFIAPFIGLFSIITCVSCCMSRNTRREQNLLTERFNQLEIQINALETRTPAYTTQPPPMRVPQTPYVLQPPFAHPYATAPAHHPQQYYQPYMKTV